MREQTPGPGSLFDPVLHILTKNAIHVAAMADIVDYNRNGFRIHFVHDTVIANSKTIEMLCTMKFQRL